MRKNKEGENLTRFALVPQIEPLGRSSPGRHRSDAEIARVSSPGRRSEKRGDPHGSFTGDGGVGGLKIRGRCVKSTPFTVIVGKNVFLRLGVTKKRSNDRFEHRPSTNVVGERKKFSKRPSYDSEKFHFRSSEEMVACLVLCLSFGFVSLLLKRKAMKMRASI